MVIEEKCPPGVLPSTELMLGLLVSIHEAEALGKAIIETVERLNR